MPALPAGGGHPAELARSGCEVWVSSLSPNYAVAPCGSRRRQGCGRLPIGDSDLIWWFGRARLDCIGARSTEYRSCVQGMNSTARRRRNAAAKRHCRKMPLKKIDCLSLLRSGPTWRRGQRMLQPCPCSKFAWRQLDEVQTGTCSLRRLDARSDGADRQLPGRQWYRRPKEVVWDGAAGSPYRAKDAFGCHGGIENSSIKRDANGARWRWSRDRDILGGSNR